ncbi:translation initiation factor IF-2, partial [Kutzneria sp. 744]
MSREGSGLLGRDSELAMIEQVAGRPMLLVVRAGSGAGKTALLDEVRRSWAARDVKSLHIQFDDETPRWDRFGANAVVAAFRKSFTEFGDSRMATALAAVSQLCLPDTYRSARARSGLFVELVRLFGSLGQDVPPVVVFDDLHAASDPGLAVTAARHAGCTVVAACREDAIAEPTSLTSLADHVLDLEPLSDGQVDELVANAVRAPLDQAVAPAVRAALGCLRGNPGSVLSVLETLQRQGSLTAVLGVLCLAEPAEPIALPADHELVRLVELVPEVGPALVAVVATTERFRVDDLLAFSLATGRDHGTCGRVTDLLVAGGALGCDAQGALSITCPALATAVLNAVGEGQVRDLHRALAEHLLRGDHSLPPEPAVVADHIALAGAALPLDAALVPLLCGEAARVLLAKPALAARWYRAALVHCRPQDPVRAREMTSALLRLLVRIGRYDWLGEVVGEAVAAGVSDRERYELAVSATLAALHTGVPTPQAVREALAADPAGVALLRFGDSWFDGREALRLDEVTAAFAPFRRGV